jgi:hypothetical protein
MGEVSICDYSFTTLRYCICDMQNPRERGKLQWETSFRGRGCRLFGITVANRRFKE